MKPRTHFEMADSDKPECAKKILDRYKNSKENE